jgi:excisionase family DNA binding protein
MTDEMDDLLTPAELMEALSISRATYSRLLRDGRLRGVRVGGRWRFARESLDELLAGEGEERARGFDAARELFAERLGKMGWQEPEDPGMTADTKSREEGLARMVLDHALLAGATDVHLDPVADGFAVRERIGGELVPMTPAIGRIAGEGIVAALVRMAAMDEERGEAPQSGRFFAPFADRRIDVRASTYPTGLGRSLTLRLLDPARVATSVEALGFSPPLIAGIRGILARPRGVVIVNGPQGAGKTSTHYAMLFELLRPGVKIMTIEDPVEMHIDGVLQGAVTPAMGFRDAMLAMLRNDLDVGLVSELRDAETMRLLFQMAGTGHLLLSALHASDAATAVSRILEMGEIPPRMVTENLLGILDQRLAPASCPDCREVATPSAKVADRLHLPEDLRNAELPRNKGCDACHGTGSKGRTVVAELLRPDDGLRTAILDGARTPEAIRAALPADHAFMRDDVHRRLREGRITPEVAAAILA